MTVGSVFRSLRADLVLEAAHHHWPAQAWRLGRVFMYTLGAQLIASSGHITGWSGLWSLLAGATESAYRQWRKTMPVPVVQRTVDEHEAALAAPARTDT